MPSYTSNPKRIATIGGTFDALHKGHKSYIELAFEFADEVILYLTTPDYVKWRKSYQISTFEQRARRIRGFAASRGWGDQLKIREHKSRDDFLNDFLQEFTSEDARYIAVISPEYYDRFLEINAEREKRGLEGVLLMVKPRHRERQANGDLMDISSTTIRQNGNTSAAKLRAA